MRKHPLLVLSTCLLTLSALGLLGTGGLTNHRSSATPKGASPRVVLARAVWRRVRRARPSVAATAPLPFLVSIARAAHRTVLLSHVHPRHPRPAAAVAPTANPTWVALRNCESGGDYTANTGNGYYGAYQFAAATWWGLGFPGLPSSAPPTVQDHAAQLLESRVGWGAWPVCSVLLGLR